MNTFKINFLDHVAIRVKDIEISIKWYQTVLGLKKYQFDEWGPIPIFMMTGRTGVALFPANAAHPKLPDSKNVKIDHFAFNVDMNNFNKAQQHLSELGVPFEFQDHHYFHSIYLKDPDNHKVELTTIVVDENSFYK